MYPFKMLSGLLRVSLMFYVVLFFCLSCAVAQETVTLSEYGGRATFGIALGGGGIVGVPVRIYFTEKTALELAAFYRPVIIIGGGESDPGGPMFTGGFDFYFNKRYVPGKQKVRLNGLFVKGGYGFSNFLSTSLVGFGWAHEMMHKGNQSYSFSFELGPGMMFNNKKSALIDVNAVQFVIYWKLHWGWALKPGF